MSRNPITTAHEARYKKYLFLQNLLYQSINVSLQKKLPAKEEKILATPKILSFNVGGLFCSPRPHEVQAQPRDKKNQYQLNSLNNSNYGSTITTAPFLFFSKKNKLFFLKKAARACSGHSKLNSLGIKILKSEKNVNWLRAAPPPLGVDPRSFFTAAGFGGLFCRDKNNNKIWGVPQSVKNEILQKCATREPFRMVNSKKVLKFVGTSVSYKKSLFCYWLLPFVGFISCIATVVDSKNLTSNSLNNNFLINLALSKNNSNNSSKRAALPQSGSAADINYLDSNSKNKILKRLRRRAHHLNNFDKNTNKFLTKNLEYFNDLMKELSNSYNINLETQLINQLQNKSNLSYENNLPLSSYLNWKIYEKLKHNESKFKSNWLNSSLKLSFFEKINYATDSMIKIDSQMPLEFIKVKTINEKFQLSFTKQSNLFFGKRLEKDSCSILNHLVFKNSVNLKFKKEKKIELDFMPLKAKLKSLAALPANNLKQKIVDHKPINFNNLFCLRQNTAFFVFKNKIWDGRACQAKNSINHYCHHPKGSELNLFKLTHKNDEKISSFLIGISNKKLNTAAALKNFNLQSLINQTSLNSKNNVMPLNKKSNSLLELEEKNYVPNFFYTSKNLSKNPLLSYKKSSVLLDNIIASNFWGQRLQENLNVNSGHNLENFEKLNLQINQRMNPSNFHRGNPPAQSAGSGGSFSAYFQGLRRKKSQSKFFRVALPAVKGTPKESSELKKPFVFLDVEQRSAGSAEGEEKKVGAKQILNNKTDFYNALKFKIELNDLYCSMAIFKPALRSNFSFRSAEKNSEQRSALRAAPKEKKKKSVQSKPSKKAARKRSPADKKQNSNWTLRSNQLKGETLNSKIWPQLKQNLNNSKKTLNRTAALKTNDLLEKAVMFLLKKQSLRLHSKGMSHKDWGAPHIFGRKGGLRNQIHQFETFNNHLIDKLNKDSLYFLIFNCLKTSLTDIVNLGLDLFSAELAAGPLKKGHGARASREASALRLHHYRRLGAGAAGHKVLIFDETAFNKKIVQKVRPHVVSPYEDVAVSMRACKKANFYRRALCFAPYGAGGGQPLFSGLLKAPQSFCDSNFMRAKQFENNLYKNQTSTDARALTAGKINFYLNLPILNAGPALRASGDPFFLGILNLNKNSLCEHHSKKSLNHQFCSKRALKNPSLKSSKPFPARREAVPFFSSGSEQREQKKRTEKNCRRLERRSEAEGACGGAEQILNNKTFFDNFNTTVSEASQARARLFQPAGFLSGGKISKETRIYWPRVIKISGANFYKKSSCRRLREQRADFFKRAAPRLVFQNQKKQISFDNFMRALKIRPYQKIKKTGGSFLEPQASKLKKPFFFVEKKITESQRADLKVSTSNLSFKNILTHHRTLNFSLRHSHKVRANYLNFSKYVNFLSKQIFSQMWVNPTNSYVLHDFTQSNRRRNQDFIWGPRAAFKDCFSPSVSTALKARFKKILLRRHLHHMVQSEARAPHQPILGPAAELEKKKGPLKKGHGARASREASALRLHHYRRLGAGAAGQKFNKNIYHLNDKVVLKSPKYFFKYNPLILKNSHKKGLENSAAGEQLNLQTSRCPPIFSSACNRRNINFQIKKSFDTKQHQFKSQLFRLEKIFRSYLSKKNNLEKKIDIHFKHSALKPKELASALRAEASLFLPAMQRNQSNRAAFPPRGSSTKCRRERKKKGLDHRAPFKIGALNKPKNTLEKLKPAALPPFGGAQAQKKRATSYLGFKTFQKLKLNDPNYVLCMKKDLTSKEFKFIKKVNLIFDQKITDKNHSRQLSPTLYLKNRAFITGELKKCSPRSAGSAARLEKKQKSSRAKRGRRRLLRLQAQPRGIKKLSKKPINQTWRAPRFDIFKLDYFFPQKKGLFLKRSNLSADRFLKNQNLQTKLLLQQTTLQNGLKSFSNSDSPLNNDRAPRAGKGLQSIEDKKGFSKGRILNVNLKERAADINNSSNYFSLLEKRKYEKKKRRKKKQRKETRRRKKRKRFFPRPSWLRFKLYSKFLKSRHFFNFERVNVQTEARPSRLHHNGAGAQPAGFLSGGHQIHAISTFQKGLNITPNQRFKKQGAVVNKNQLQSLPCKHLENILFAPIKICSAASPQRGKKRTSLQKKLPASAATRSEKIYRNYDSAFFKGTLEESSVFFRLPRKGRAQKKFFLQKNFLSALQSCTNNWQEKSAASFAHAAPKFKARRRLGLGNATACAQEKNKYHARSADAAGYFSYVPFFVNKDFYQISRTVLGDLKRVFWKSYWLRSNLNPYLNRVKTYLNDMKQSTKNWDIYLNLQHLKPAVHNLFLMETNSSIREIPELRPCAAQRLRFFKGKLEAKKNKRASKNEAARLNHRPFQGLSSAAAGSPFFQGFFDLQNCQEINLSSNKWQIVINFASYQRIMYERIQQTILNIRENLNVNGQIRARSYKIGRQKLLTPKPVKDFWIKFGKTVTFENPNHEAIEFYGDMSKLRTWWTLNKSNLASFKPSNKRKDLWTSQKLREQSQSNKTKKIVYQMIQNLNNMLDEKSTVLESSHGARSAGSAEGEEKKVARASRVTTSVSSQFKSCPQAREETEVDGNVLLKSLTIKPFFNPNKDVTTLQNVDKIISPHRAKRGHRENQALSIVFDKLKRSLEISENKLRKKENKLSYLGFFRAEREHRKLKINNVSLEKNYFRDRRHFRLSLKKQFQLLPLLHNHRTLSVNSALRAQTNVSFNKFTSQYNYWWKGESLELPHKVQALPAVKTVKIIPTFKNSFPIVLNSNLFLLLTCTFLFHFCALISLISSREVRGVIKFYTILASKIFKAYLDVIFSMCQLLKVNPIFGDDIFFIKIAKLINSKHKLYLGAAPSLNGQNNFFKKSFKQSFNTTSPFQTFLFNLCVPLTNGSKQLFKQKRVELNNFLKNGSCAAEQAQPRATFYLGLETNQPNISVLNNSSWGTAQIKNSRRAKRGRRRLSLIYLSVLNLMTKPFLWFEFLNFKHTNQMSNLKPNFDTNQKLANKQEMLKAAQKNAGLLFLRRPFFLSLRHVAHLRESQHKVREKRNFKGNPGRNELILCLKFKPVLSADFIKLLILSCLNFTISSSYKGSFSLRTSLIKSFDIFQAILGSIYLFLEKPGELIVDWIAYAFLVEWSSDLTTNIPDAVDISTISSYFKTSRIVRPFVIGQSFLTLSPIGLTNSLIQRQIWHFYQALIEQLCQPDTDLIIRQKKGVIFWDIWAELLIDVAEDANVNISELTSLKEEQNRLLDKLEQSTTSNLMYLKNKNVRLALKRTSSADVQYHLKEEKNSFFIHHIYRDIRAFISKSTKKTTKIVKNSNFFKTKLLKHHHTLNQLFLGSNKHHSPNPLPLGGGKGKGPAPARSAAAPLGAGAGAEKQNTWSVNQFLSYQGKDTELFIDLHPPKSFSHIPSIKYSQSIQQPIGTIICQIFSGIFHQQIAKNILVVGSPGMEKTLLIQAIAGETELKIITDNAHRYAMVYRGVAVGIKLLRDVFEALSLHSPCIFLLEDIHHIGERRPFLISDDENTKATEFGSEKEEIHEKNQVIYQLSKHFVSHYKKPYKGDFSLLIPTNHFCFNLFLGVSSPRTRTYQTTPSTPFSTAIFTKSKLDQNQFNASFNRAKRGHRRLKIKPNEKDNILASYLQIKSDQLLAPPATSPFSVLILKEEKKLKPKQIVKEMPWSGLPGEQLALISKANYSIRVKIALLADMALSNVSVKLDMITDLLVIIDSVKGNRGFIVFATTHLPYILDPALRRPGRFDETISLPLIPNLFSRWEILKTNQRHFTQPSLYSSFPKGSTIDFVKIATTDISGFFNSNFDDEKLSDRLVNFHFKDALKKITPNKLANKEALLCDFFFFSRPHPHEVQVQAERAKIKGCASREPAAAHIREPAAEAALPRLRNGEKDKNFMRPHSLRQHKVQVQAQALKVNKSKIGGLHHSKPAALPCTINYHLKPLKEPLINPFKLQPLIYGSSQKYKLNESSHLNKTNPIKLGDSARWHKKNYLSLNSIGSIKDLTEIKHTRSFFVPPHEVHKKSYFFGEPKKIEARAPQLNDQRAIRKKGPKPLSKTFFNVIARTYFSMSRILTYLSSMKFTSINSHPKGSALDLTSVNDFKACGSSLRRTPGGNLEKISTDKQFIIPPTDLILFDCGALLPPEKNIYLSLYGSNKTLKQHLTQLMAGKLGEIFAFSNFNFKKGSTRRKKGQSFQNDLNMKIVEQNEHIFMNSNIATNYGPFQSSLYGIDKTWRAASSLLFSVITKRYLRNKNLINPKLLYFSNYSSLHEAPSPPSSNILLPLKRYENYRRTFNSEQIKHKANFQVLQTTLELHQQQRLVKRLYKLPIREFFRSEIISDKLTGFGNSSITLSSVEKHLIKPTNMHWYYRNRILNRHRNYLNTQWWNGQLSEHNTESTFLSDIDWRYTFVESIGDIFIDFPDSDQFYNARNRRWILTSGTWNNWFNFDKTTLYEIYQQYTLECFTKVYNSLDQNREILDFYAFTSLNQCMLKDLKEITIMNIFKRFS